MAIESRTAATPASADQASDSLVVWERQGAVGVLTLNNPARRNVLSRAMLTELATRLRTASADRTIKCLVLRAAGPVFSAGHDLAEVRSASPAELESLFALCTQVMETLRLAPQPVIAEVQGLATAAGCQLAATCDLVVAAEGASFATPGVKIGLFCSTPAVALARAVPTKQALEMLFTGTPISAAQAERLGLVNRVVPATELAATTRELAERIAGASGDTLALGKQAFYAQLGLDRPRAYELAQGVMVDNAQREDAIEGMQAFLEKRSPQWRH
ncbi:MAG: enoyl-CoA hydratase [Pirellulales bacterium]|nr:enoyl-CoA hydratase [Pirellulales bacterium]